MQEGVQGHCPRVFFPLIGFLLYLAQGGRTENNGEMCGGRLHAEHLSRCSGRQRQYLR